MDKRKILTLASAAAILLVPAAFYAATEHQRSAARLHGDRVCLGPEAR